MIMLKIGLGMMYVLYAYSLYEDIIKSVNIRNEILSRLKIAEVIIHCYILVISLSSVIGCLPCFIMSSGGGIVALINYYILSKKGW